jgi:hypothetical protein
LGAFGSTVSGLQFDEFTLAIDSTGRLYGSLRDYTTPHLSTIDAATAVPTVGASTTTFLDQMDFHPDGSLYATNGGTWLKVNPVTGAFTTFGSNVLGLYDIAFDSTGVLWGSTGDALYTFDLTTGAATFKGTLSTAGQLAISGIAFDENDVLFGVSNTLNSRLFTINTSTYAATLVGLTGLSQVWDIDFAPAAVPLPSAALMGAGLLGGLAIVARLRKRRQTPLA